MRRAECTGRGDADRLTAVVRDPSATGEPRVLLVDDSPVSQQVVCCMLEALGCEVVVVADGAIAVEQALGSRFDVVLMDCQMPRVDGFEATRRIRSREVAQRRLPVPIVAITGDTLPADRERCLEAGMTDFISKPFTVGNLRVVLETAAGRLAAGPRDGSLPSGRPAEVLPPVIDAAQIDELRSLGRPEILRKAVMLFLRQGSEQLDALDLAVAGGFFREVAQAAHSLKSAALSVGGQRFAAAAGNVERLATAGRSDEAATAVGRLRPEFRQLRVALAGFATDAGERVA